MQEDNEENSFGFSEKVVEQFTKNPNFPYLVSFPRTGSHWLRMLMELYFEKPSLIRAFYYSDAKSFTCYHRHDEDLVIQRKNVIYLYRNPIPTVYSQMKFYNEDMKDGSKIKHWAEIYAKHLDKWLFKESFTTKKTILTYEGLKNDLFKEFEKLCLHFNLPFDKAKLDEIQKRVTKEKLKAKTKHDPRVLNLSKEYEQERILFEQNNKQLIADILGKQNSETATIFSL